MNALYFTRTWLAFSAIALLSACATPKPIRDLADQGSATVGLAEASLREYMALTNAQLGARMDLVRQQAQQRARDQSNRELLVMQNQRAGVPAAEAGAKLIRSLGAERRKLREQAALAQDQIAQEYAFDGSALGPVPTDKLAAARKGFGVLAQELSPQEWVALSAGYIKEIAAGVQSLSQPAAPTPAGENQSTADN